MFTVVVVEGLKGRAWRGNNPVELILNICQSGEKEEKVRRSDDGGRRGGKNKNNCFFLFLRFGKDLNSQ